MFLHKKFPIFKNDIEIIMIIMLTSTADTADYHSQSENPDSLSQSRYALNLVL